MNPALAITVSMWLISGCCVDKLDKAVSAELALAASYGTRLTLESSAYVAVLLRRD